MKKLLNCVLLLCFAVALSVSVRAASSEMCGINVSWTLDDAGTLTISGTGKMTDYL